MGHESCRLLNALSRACISPRAFTCTVVLIRACVHTFYVCVCSNYTKCWNYTSDAGAMNLSMVSLPAFPVPLYSPCAHASTHLDQCIGCLSKRPRKYVGRRAWARDQNVQSMTEDNQGTRDHVRACISKSKDVSKGEGESWSTPGGFGTVMAH